MSSELQSNGVRNDGVKCNDNGEKGNSNKPFLIGVSGGTASGKSSVCKKIVQQLNTKGDEELNQRVFVVSLDSFYKKLDEEELALAARNLYNFDHPRAFDYELLKSTMLKMLQGEPVEIHQYDHMNFKSIKADPVRISRPDVVFIEGILVFYQEDIKALFDLKLFVETDADTRLARRVLRDTETLGRSLENILHQYVNHVKPAFEEFCLPTKKYADVIIPRGADNDVAVEVIVQHIKDLLRKRSSSSPPSAEQQCNIGSAEGRNQQQQQQLHQQLQQQQQLQRQLQQQQLLIRSNSSSCNSSSQGTTLLNLRPH